MCVNVVSRNKDLPELLLFVSATLLSELLLFVSANLLSLRYLGSLLKQHRLSQYIWCLLTSFFVGMLELCGQKLL
jgi:hypothetical protein